MDVFLLQNLLDIKHVYKMLFKIVALNRPLKGTVVEVKIPEKGLKNLQISSVGFWNQRNPTHLPLLLILLFSATRLFSIAG